VTGTNPQGGGRHAGAAHSAAHQPADREPASVAISDPSRTSQLSASLPVLDVDSMPERNMGVPVITLDHVTKVYPAQPDRPALKDVSLQIYAGEFSLVIRDPANRPLCAF
jgi:cell division transport system ATP-binding protein